MEAQITVRSASLQDAQLLAELAAKTFYETFVASNTEEDMKSYLEKNFTVSQIELELEEHENTFLLAQLGGSIVGYAKMKKK